MKQLIKFIVIVIIGFFITDRIGTIGMKALYSNTDNEHTKKMRYISSGIKEDCLIMGSSGACHHFVPSIFEDSLGLSTYNCGFDGSGDIFFNYSVLALLLKRHIPKMIIFEIGNMFFNNDAKTIARLYPYIGKSSITDSVINCYGNYYLCYISHLYRYKIDFPQNLRDIWGGREYIKGYMPLKYAPVNMKLINSPYKKDITPQIKNYLSKFILLCKHNNITLVFVTIPMYSIVKSNTYAPIDSIAKKYNIPYYNYHALGLFHDKPDLFINENHFCDKGAKMFSSIVLYDLKKYLSKKKKE